MKKAAAFLCNHPPVGWYCTRHWARHDGPCAALPMFWWHPIWWLRLHVVWNLWP